MVYGYQAVNADYTLVTSLIQHCASWPLHAVANVNDSLHVGGLDCI